MPRDEQVIRPDWSAPENVCALVTTRAGGVSEGPWTSLNLGINTADDPHHVWRNQQRLGVLLGAGMPVQWLRQVHGDRVADVGPGGTPWPEADACYTDARGRVCAVLTADCLPVLFCSRDGREVAAAHAGWRGLASGVLVRTVERFRAPPTGLMAWLGPAIGPRHYEVGEDVRRAFLLAPGFAGLDVAAAFAPAAADKWRADLYHLARMQLQALGLGFIGGGTRCTYSEAEHFYSYRRDGETGRFASLIWLKN